MTRLGRAALGLSLAAMVALTTGAHVLAQEDARSTTISRIGSGEAGGDVYLEGAVLAPLAEGGYLFSDGTGVVAIELDAAAGEGGAVPLFTLIGVRGAMVEDVVDVAAWERLRIAVPAVLVPEPEVIDAFREWVIAYGSRAPLEDAPTEE